MTRIFNLPLNDLREAAGLKKHETLKCLILPDKHYPHHCIKTHKATLEFAKDYKPHVFLSIGDWWEMGPVSHWQGNINFDLLREEFEGGIKLLKEIEKACGNNLVYKGILLGNHELWYKKLISKQAPGLRKFLKQSGMDMHIKNVSGLSKAGYEVFGYNEGLEISGAIYTHGVYTNKHHALKHVDTYQKTVLYGHTESQQLFTKVSALGVTQGICLGTQRDEKQCTFLNGSPTAWVTALGVVEYDDQGEYTVYNPKINDGRFGWGGKIYGA